MLTLDRIVPILVGVIMGVTAGLLARQKGYSFFVWFFTGLFGFVVVPLLPDAHEVTRPLTLGEIKRLKRQGNYIGVVTAVLGCLLIEFLRAFLYRWLRPQ